MTDEQKAAYINAMVACANAEVEAMRRANADYEHQRDCNLPSGIPFTADDFRAVIDKYGIHHNAVIGLFHGG